MYLKIFDKPFVFRLQINTHIKDYISSGLDADLTKATYSTALAVGGVGVSPGPVVTLSTAPAFRCAAHLLALSQPLPCAYRGHGERRRQEA